MTTRQQFFLHRILLAVALVAAISAATLLVLPLIPPSDEGLQRSLAVVERSDRYEVSADGKVLFLLDDYDNWTTAHIAVCTADSALPDISRKQLLAATWARRPLTPRCRGRLFVAGADTSQWNARMAAATPIVLRQQRLVLQNRMKTVEKRIEELQYFLRVHNVTDEGFNVVANYESLAKEELKTLRTVCDLLADSLYVGRMRARLVQQYTLLYHNDSTNSSQQLPCRVLKADTLTGTYIVQTQDRWMPDDARPQYDVALTRSFRQKHDSLLSLPLDTAFATITMSSEGARYQGETNAEWMPDGHGIMYSANGKVYDGMWSAGLRNGFGISLDSDGSLRVGEWLNDVYQGERLTYSVDHVYGIDISRYQHEKGRKKYAINWSRLRISSLGTKSKKRISGEVDYPVDFCFVKSTEGTSVRNKYYASDCKQARRHGINVGSYHFFSLKSPATAQAQTFLKYSSFPKGDLPPVLDVEPTEAQIKAYGGSEKLLSDVRTWLQVVERRLGVRPILYVNQTFVTRHLAKAPDIKHDYQVWIARYGEYKPDVRLAIWQLSPDGHVKGIQGEVDINIFNGYRDQYEEFLEKNSIP